VLNYYNHTDAVCLVSMVDIADGTFGAAAGSLDDGCRVCSEVEVAGRVELGVGFAAGDWYCCEYIGFSDGNGVNVLTTREPDVDMVSIDNC